MTNLTVRRPDSSGRIIIGKEYKDKQFSVQKLPNGDILLSEPGPSRIHIFRAEDGADKPTISQDFATGLDHPFGIAFYPPNSSDPQWLYVANHNSIVRIPYKNGDLQAGGKYQVIVPTLVPDGGHGGHSTRDVAFSNDGKRMFISVGSGSNVSQGGPDKSPDEIKAWEADHGLGATWGSEENRADILVTDPEGKAPLHTFATGIRNGVGIAVNPTTGDLWTSVNERDGLGDETPPDYLTSVHDGGFYGWPYCYWGQTVDDRVPQDPTAVAKAITPDYALGGHTASLGLCWLPAGTFPGFEEGMAIGQHGSWNRSTLSGYKVVFIPFANGRPAGPPRDILSGFLAPDERESYGRPVGVTIGPDGSLLVADDVGNVIWRVTGAR